MDVVIYGRVSTQSQDYQRQINELEVYSKAFNYNVIKTFTEIISGSKTGKDRKEISNLIDFIDDNPNIKGVLISELSRLGRDTSDILENIKRLNKRKVWLYSKEENIYTLNKDGTLNTNAEFMLTILSGVASYERKAIIQRSISGLRNNTKAGNWVGGAILPYGYKRVNKKLEVIEEEAEIVKMIYSLYLEGKGTKSIANILNEKKVKTRYNLSLKKDFLTINNNNIRKEDFKWRDGTVYGILTNKVYIGEKKGKNKLEGINLQSPLIIDKNVFNKVQQALKDKKVERKTIFFYLFQNKLFCGRCNRTYFPHKRKPKIKGKVSKDSRYICLSKRYNESCDNYGIGISKINDGVWSVLRNNKEQIDNILKLNNSNIKNIDEEINAIKEEKTKCELRIKQFEKQEKKLVDLLLTVDMNPEVYQSKYDELIQGRNAKLSELEVLIKELNSKEKFKKKQSDSNLQIRTIKENKRILKKTIDDVINKILIYPVYKHNLNDYRKLNKQDKFVFVEIYTYLNETTPLIFLVSQRSNLIITPKYDEFNKDDCELRIGGFEEFEGEEEASEILIRELYHLSILD